MGGGTLRPVDEEGEKLAVGFTGDNRLVWIERRGLTGEVLAGAGVAVALPDDLYAFSDLTAAGAGRVGFAGARRPVCNQVAQPCEGPAPPFQRRWVVVDVDGRTVAWQSEPFPAATAFLGMTG